MKTSEWSHYVHTG